MVQRREHPRLAIEARESIGITRKGRRQHLDRDIAAQPCVAGAVDLTHATGTDPRRDLVRTDALACQELRRRGVGEQHGRRLEKALGVRIRRQQRRHLVAQHLVAGARLGQVRRAQIDRQRPRLREHLFQTSPVVRGQRHMPGILLPTGS